MAARVLVVERVVEQRLGLANRRVLGDKRHLAQAAGTLIGVQDARKRVATDLGIKIDHAAALKTKPEPVDLVAWRTSGKAECTTPSTRSQCGDVNTSSVGMLGKNT